MAQDDTESNIKLKKVEKFSLYLFKVWGIDSILKIQKILFFLRVYEKKMHLYEKKKIGDSSDSPIFDKDNYNFQAWMYGPVDIVSYHFMRLKLYSNEQESNDDTLLELRDDIKKGIFNRYEHVINNLKDIDSQELIELSHHNHEYKRVRGNLGVLEPCKKELDENRNEFKIFDDKFNKKVNEVFCIENDCNDNK